MLGIISAAAQYKVTHPQIHDDVGKCPILMFQTFGEVNEMRQVLEGILFIEGDYCWSYSLPSFEIYSANFMYQI